LSGGWQVEDGFDLDAFLSQSLMARVATAGPSVRPVWYLWEDRAFWWLTGGWSRLPTLLERNPRVALVVDTCDLRTGNVLQVLARGSAELLPFDQHRARRWGSRYLGADERRWSRFADGVFHDPSTRFLRLAPTSLRARDLSYSPAPVPAEEELARLATACNAAGMDGTAPGGERLPRPRTARSRWTSFVADSPSGSSVVRGLHEETNPQHRIRVEHDAHTLLIHLSGEDGDGWTTIAVDRGSRRWTVAQDRRQATTAREAYERLYE